MKVINENLYTWKEVSSFCDISSGLTVGQYISLRTKVKESLVVGEDYYVNKYDEVMFYGHSIKKILPIVQEYKSKVEKKRNKVQN